MTVFPRPATSWLHPDGKTLLRIPDFDTDPAAAMGLLGDALRRGWYWSIWRRPFCLQIWGRDIESITVDLRDDGLVAAVAEAWLAAMKGKRGG